MALRNADQGQAIPRSMIIEMLAKKFEKLPDIDRYKAFEAFIYFIFIATKQ